jgi:predicted adenylyl cyclase CyaB
MKEIEILVKVLEGKQSALRKLRTFKSIGAETVIDHYFYDPKRKELRPNRKGAVQSVFRLRQKGAKSFMTYKVDHLDRYGNWSHSDEHEIEVSDFKVAENIVKRLGLKPLVKIHNKRNIFRKGNYEILLEDVKGLGLFLEIERLDAPSDASVPKIRKDILKLMGSLGIRVSEEVQAGKPELMLKKGF